MRWVPLHVKFLHPTTTGCVGATRCKLPPLHHHWERWVLLQIRFLYPISTGCVECHFKLRITTTLWEGCHFELVITTGSMGCHCKLDFSKVPLKISYHHPTTIGCVECHYKLDFSTNLHWVLRCHFWLVIWELIMGMRNVICSSTPTLSAVVEWW